MGLKVIDVVRCAEAEKYLAGEKRREDLWNGIKDRCPAEEVESDGCGICMALAPQAKGTAPWGCYWMHCPRIVEDA